MKESTATRLKRLLDERGLKQVDIIEKAEPFCKKYGIKLTKSDLSQYVSGKVAPGQDKLSIIGMTLDVSEAWLMGYDVPMKRGNSHKMSDDSVPPGFEPLPEMESVPLVGRIACGQPITAEENLEGYVSIPAAWHATFTLKCCGDSMEPRIKDGDLVAIRKDVQVENGQIAAVRIGDEATLKHLYFHEDYIELRPENPVYSSIIRRKEEMNDVTIEGKAVGLCRGL